MEYAQPGHVRGSGQGDGTCCDDPNSGFRVTTILLSKKASYETALVCGADGFIGSIS